MQNPDGIQVSRSDIRLGIVCPMANEGPEAARFVMETLRHCAGFREAAFFAVLDNATTDDSLHLLRELALTEARLRVIWAPENQCVVDAYMRGYREALAAGSDWILELDAGFSHQPEDIPQFFAAMEQGCYACVFGCRFMKGSRLSDLPWKRRLVSWGGTWAANLLLGTRLKDMTSGFELFSRGALEMVVKQGVQSRAHFWHIEVKVYCRGLSILEVPIHYRAPSPRMGGAEIWESFRQLWRLRKLYAAGRL